MATNNRSKTKPPRIGGDCSATSTSCERENEGLAFLGLKEYVEAMRVMYCLEKDHLDIMTWESTLANVYEQRRLYDLAVPKANLLSNLHQVPQRLWHHSERLQPA
jgi:hypothetical protein